MLRFGILGYLGRELRGRRNRRMMEVREGVIGKKSLRMKGRGEMRRVGLTIDWRRKWRMLREGERWERGEESDRK